MITRNKLFVLCLILFLALDAAAWGKESGPSGSTELRRHEFETRCPKPEWWDRVPVSDTRIYTYGDLLKYWQNKERSESQFFKAAYQSILDHPEDADLVVLALKLMPHAYSYPHRTALQEYAIKHYFLYRNPYGKPADSIGSIVENLAHLYNDAEEYDPSVSLIERFLTERGTHANDHILELIHLRYAEALYGQKRTNEAINILKKAVQEYNGSWEKRLNETLAKYQGHATEPPSQNIPEPAEDRPGEKIPWWKDNRVTAAASLVVFLWFVLWMRGNRPRSRSQRTYPPRGSSTDGDVELLVRQGRKIAAIKLYRKIHKTGLKESKDTVEKMARRSE